MTGSEVQPPAGAERARGSPSRILEWFWRGDALRRARAKQAGLASAATLCSRARIAAEVGAYALNPSGPWASGNADYLACGLFAESIGWSLRLAASSTGNAAESPLADKPPLPDELAALLERYAPLVADAAQEPERLARAQRHLLARDFEAITASTDDLAQAARELRGLSERLLQSTGAAQNLATSVMLQRFARVGGLLLLLGLLVGAAGFLRGRMNESADLSQGKPWVASSMLELACQSPFHQCASHDAYFFHTLEEASPWLEIDLQQTTRFSSVQVFNRKNCCPERATPLVIEISSDHQRYQEVARRNEPFEEWQAKVGQVSARWVRLRVDRRSYFHLYDVRVLP